MKNTTNESVLEALMERVRKSTRTRTDLKPCPFCGSTVTSKIGPLGTTMFVCDICGADVCFYGAEESEKADVAWNRRPE